MDDLKHPLYDVIQNYLMSSSAWYINDNYAHRILSHESWPWWRRLLRWRCKYCGKF